MEVALGITFTRDEIRAIYLFNQSSRRTHTVDVEKLEAVLESKGSSLDAFKTLFKYFTTNAPALQAGMAAIRKGALKRGRQGKYNVAAAKLVAGDIKKRVAAQRSARTVAAAAAALMTHSGRAPRPRRQ